MIRIAGPVQDTALRLFGLAGLTMPWGVAYIRAAHDSTTLRAHENMHLYQLMTMGWLAYSRRYVWRLLRHGYYWHPMEIEARIGAGEWEPQEHWAGHPVMSRYHPLIVAQLRAIGIERGRAVSGAYK